MLIDSDVLVWLTRGHVGAGFDARTLRELAHVVVQNAELIERAWNEHVS